MTSNEIMGRQDYDSVFYHHICHFCKSSPSDASEKFKTCSNCKLFSYCSVSHQKSDWKRHKPFCLAVKEILARMAIDSLYSSKGNAMDPNTLYQYQCSVLKLVEMKLKRHLTGVERLSILHADLCGFCLQPNAKHPVPCMNCSVEHYCSEAHRELHSHFHVRDCANLNLCFALDLCSTISQDLPKDPLRLADDSAPVKPFPVHMIEYLKDFTSEKLSEYDRMIMSDVLSYSLTLVFALKHAKTTNFKRKENLSVHVIGAEELEALMVNILDPLLYWYPNLNSISISLIGPEAPCSVQPVHHRTKKIEVTCFPKVYYHDYARESSYTDPDVAIAFNCGLHEFQGSDKDTWKDTLAQFAKLKTGSLLVLTSYTEKESEKDSTLIQEVGSKTKFDRLRQSVNPFASLKPYRNPERGQESTFFFNHYLSVFEIK